MSEHAWNSVPGDVNDIEVCAACGARRIPNVMGGLRWQRRKGAYWNYLSREKRHQLPDCPGRPGPQALSPSRRGEIEKAWCVLEDAARHGHLDARQIDRLRALEERLKGQP